MFKNPEFGNKIKQTMEAFRQSDGTFEKGEHSPSELLEKIKDPALNKQQRIKAVINLLKELWPGESTPILPWNTIYKDNEQMPFDPDQYKISDWITSGGQHEVYLLEPQESNQPSLVMKVNYVQSGSVDELVKIASEDKQEHQKMQELYKSIPDFIPNELLYIGEGPKNLRFSKPQPCIIRLQTFFGNHLKDPYTELDKDELVNCLRSEPELAAHLREFIQITDSHKKSHGEAIDIIGERNLALLEKDGNHSLVFVDSDGLKYIRAEDKYMDEQIEKRLRYFNEALQTAVDVYDENSRKAA